jgi:hypothetical protein
MRCLAAGAAVVTAGSLVLAASAPAFPGHNGALAFTGFIEDRSTDSSLVGLFRGDTGSGALPMGTCAENDVVGFSVCPFYRGLSFSADGTRVAVEQIDTPPEAPVAGSRLAIASGGGLPSALPALTSGDADPAWSNNDTKLVFTGDLSVRGTGLGRIYTVAPDGSHLRRLTSARDSRDPRWSPNGRYIAFVRFVGRRADLWVMRADGGHAHRLTRDVGTPGDPSPSGPPSWSPRSSVLAFVHRGAIYTIGLDGRHLRRVTPSRRIAEASNPAWSPNGVRIAFSSLDSSGPIWTIDPSGAHLHLQAYVSPSNGDVTIYGLDWQRVPSP